MKLRCPICFGKNIVQKDKKLNIFYCKPCNHQFAVIGEKEQEEYSKDYFEEHKNWFTHPNYELFEYILNKLPKRPIKLLDVGCGDGSFLKYVANKRDDIELCGIDLIENSHPQIKFIKGDIYTWTYKHEKFDVIVSLSTIEHVDDTHKFIKKLRSMSKDNGILFIDTININHLMYKISKYLKPLWRVPYEKLYKHQHLNFFSEQSLRKLVESEKLKVIENKKHNFPYNAIDVQEKNPIIEKLYKYTAITGLLLGSAYNQKLFQTIILNNNEDTHNRNKQQPRNFDSKKTF